VSYIWDTKADTVKKRDCNRVVLPIVEKTRTDGDGFKHYTFSKIMFNNPHYEIPDDDFLLFEKFLDGGSREYPSDGHVPTDLAATEARMILKDIVKISKDPNLKFHEEALEALKNGKFSLIRGTLKLYLSKLTTRDWRRKRFTDDIDFWVYKVHLWVHVLKKNGWVKNKETKEWEKTVAWYNPFSDQNESQTLIASNDTNLTMDFGGGSYLEGSALKDVLKKKVKRGLNMDISDVINVAMVFNKAEGHATDEWNNAWEAFVESANTRSKRITSNLISLCRYSFAIADYLSNVGQSLVKNHNEIFNKERYPDEQVAKVCRQVSVHWQKYLKEHGFDITREMIHEFVLTQGHLKIYHAKNLKNFAEKLINLLNLKYQHLKIIFEIEN